MAKSTKSGGRAGGRSATGKFKAGSRAAKVNAKRGGRTRPSMRKGT